MRVEGSGAGGDDWFSDMRDNSLHGTAIGQERGGRSERFYERRRNLRRAAAVMAAIV